METETHWPPMSPFTTGLRGRCPRCGKGRLFDGYLALKPRCDVCGLDFSFADPADGPAFFAICIACVPAVAFACWLEVVHSPPIWVHFLTSLPVTLVACLLPLRPLKGWLINSQYFYKAEQGTIDTDHRRPSRGKLEKSGE